MQGQEKRGPGRPRKGEGTEHLDLTLSVEVITFLRTMTSGDRSNFVDRWIKQHPSFDGLKKEGDMSKSQWVGSEGRLFERVGLVFECLGYSKPTPDVQGGNGAYAMNIVSQYVAGFTEEEVLQVIDYARHDTVENLRAHKEYGALDREDVFSERS
jgi:hypothetical protein